LGRQNRIWDLPDVVLGQIVTIREDKRERRVTAAEAFLLQLTQKGHAENSAAAWSSPETIEKAQAVRDEDRESIKVIVMKAVTNGPGAFLEKLDLVRLSVQVSRG
jgi:hypothetical protein